MSLILHSNAHISHNIQYWWYYISCLIRLITRNNSYLSRRFLEKFTSEIWDIIVMWQWNDICGNYLDMKLLEWIQKNAYLVLIYKYIRLFDWALYIVRYTHLSGWIIIWYVKHIEEYPTSSCSNKFAKTNLIIRIYAKPKYRV